MFLLEGEADGRFSISQLADMVSGTPLVPHYSIPAVKPVTPTRLLPTSSSGNDRALPAPSCFLTSTSSRCFHQLRCSQQVPSEISLTSTTSAGPISYRNTEILAVMLLFHIYRLPARFATIRRTFARNVILRHATQVHVAHR